MSGGHFDYQEHRIQDVIDSIEEVIYKNKKEKSKEDLYSWDYDENGNVYEESKYYYNFSPETIQVMKEAVEILRKAYVYAHRIDYMLSGDDGEDTFHERLKEELHLEDIWNESKNYTGNDSACSTIK